MAPGAKWIGCRNMDAGNGTPARYIECMEFFLAPYPIGGGQGDPTKAPDITINSWGCPASEGCSANTLQAAVEAQAAAGIMMVVAAGNSGSNCSTVTDPPSLYASSYTAGALNTGTDTIASFSSRGPVTADGSGRIKPDISAPGTNTRSASNTSDNAYTFASGTSMATPHIAGAMALLWSAIPSLQNQIDPSRTALNNAAVHINSTQCGSVGPPNNVYGWGRVDILAAVTSASPTPTPTPTAGPITLSARGKKVGGINTSRLTWSGATSSNIDVNRDGSVIATVPNNGHYTDSTGTTGQASFTYKVCEAGTQTCSNSVVVRFRP
jgi:subtilisin family serine protease